METQFWENFTENVGIICGIFSEILSKFRIIYKEFEGYFIEID